MADIASRSRYATTNLVCDIHHITRLVLHQIGEEHRIVGYNQSIRGRGRGRGRGRVDRRGRGRDGGRGHGQDGESGCGTPEPTLPTSIPPILTPHLPYPHTLTHHLPYPYTLTYHLPYPQTLTHLYHIRCRQSQSQRP